MSDLYKQALDTAKSELECILIEETTLNIRLGEIKIRKETLRKTVDSLAALVGEEDDTQVGITQAILDFLKENDGMGYTPTGIRDELKKRGFGVIEGYRNPMAVVHTTLKRLEEQEKIKSWEKKSNTYYQYIPTEQDKNVSTITDDDIPF